MSFPTKQMVEQHLNKQFWFVFAKLMYWHVALFHKGPCLLEMYARFKVDVKKFASFRKKLFWFICAIYSRSKERHINAFRFKLYTVIRLIFYTLGSVFCVFIS